MKQTARLIPALLAGLLASCAVNPPLMFGDNLTFGLQLGTDAASGGASVTLGYKQRSVAVVPVSVLDEGNRAQALRGFNEADRDALSVFAVFESAAPSADDRVRIGQVFSTGLAAQLLTQGYECRLRGPGSCAIPPTVPATAASSSPQTQAKALAASPATKASDAQAPAAGSDRPYQKPLIYARTDVLGFSIAGSSAEQGAYFTLGYSSNNLALVPVFAPSGGLRVTGLFGGIGDVPNSRDAYSVLGQFKADTQTKSLGFGIERYFATGIAAQNLAQGLRAALAAASAASAASAPKP